MEAARPPGRAFPRPLRIVPIPLLAVVVLAAPANAQSSGDVPRLEESGCATEALEEAGAECFTLFVEEDRDDPNGTVVELPVAVLEPESGGRSAAPVFFFPGGPGYSVLGAPDLIAQYRKDVGSRALVLLDHRGMLHARPALRCPDYADVSPYHHPLFAPGVSGSLDTRERMQSITQAVERCYARLEREGVDVAQYNSYAVARDVEALRRALGYDQIDLYGRSTGGGTALAYLKYFPDRVRSAVLVSPWYNELRNRAAIDELYTLKQKYTDVLGLCVRGSRACRERVPDWLLAVERARRALDARPYVATVEAEDGARTTLYFDGAAFLHALYLFLPDVYHELPEVVADVAAGAHSGLDELFRIDEWAPEADAPRYALGYFLAHICNDMGANRPAREDSLAMVEREPALLGFEPPWACGWWGSDGDVPPEHSQPLQGDTPVLSIHGQMDPCCGLRWGRHLQETMENVRTVELQALGHTPDSECGTELVSRFLERPDAPLDDRCKGDTPLRPWKLE